MGIATRYIKKIHRETRFVAAWTPSQVLRLGDYGSVDRDGGFTRQGNVTDLGFAEVVPLTEPRPDDFLELTTESGTSVDIKIAGETLEGSAIPEASAGLVISFGKSDALVCKLKGAEQQSIENIKALQDFIIQQYKSGRWTKSWRVVSERVVAAGATIVYSDSNDVRIEATANGAVKDIADASLDFSVIRKRGGSVSLVGGANVTPFVSLVRLSDPLFRSPRIRSFTPRMVTDKEVAPVLMADDLDWLQDR